MMDVVKPEAVGFDAKRLGRVDSAMQRFIDNGQVAGIATRVLRKGQLVQQAGYGLASSEPNKAMQPDTLFRVWSMTKAVTAVAALTLYEQGYFTLNQDISEFLPEFKDTPVYVSGGGDGMRLEPRKGAITIRQAMTHSAGLASGSGYKHPVEEMMAARAKKAREAGSTLEAAVKSFAEVPLMYQPFTGWHYSFGLELIARLVEVISGERYDVFLREHIFKPLGMKDSGYFVHDDQFERFSTFYQWDENRTLKVMEAPAQSAEYRLRSQEADGRWWFQGGTGLISSPPDFARFAQMLLNGGTLDGARILEPSTVALMTTNHLPANLLPYNFPDSPPKYGYGHGLGVHVLMDRGLAVTPCKNGEYWKDGGAGTIFWVDPALDLVGIAMYQLLDFWRVPIFDTFKAVVYQAIEDEKLD